MAHLKLILHSMLSLPAVKIFELHYLIILGGLAYLGILYLVLKAFQINDDDRKK